MTVAELIAALSAFPADMPVVAADNWEVFNDVHGIAVVTVKQHNECVPLDESEQFKAVAIALDAFGRW